MNSNGQPPSHNRRRMTSTARVERLAGNLVIVCVALAISMIVLAVAFAVAVRIAMWII